MNFRESSKETWASANTIEHINSGSLQRIADACELMAQNHDALVRDRDMYKRWYEDRRARNMTLERRVSALRGVITRMNKRT